MKTIFVEDDGIDIIEKYVDAVRVPTIKEVQLFLYLERDLRWLCVWVLMFCAGLRPFEVTTIKTCNMIVDPYTCKFVGFKYHVAKARIHKRKKDGRFFKVVKVKTVYCDSYAKEKFGRKGDVGDYVMNLLERYYHEYKLTFKNKDFFNFETGRIRKEFHKRRKKMIASPGGEGFRDLIATNQNGAVPKRYRIEPYSGRRFFLSFYHFVIAKGDIIMTQRRISHTFEKDTFTYIYTKDAIGFNPEKHINFDVLLNPLPKEQTVLSNFGFEVVVESYCNREYII